MKREGATPLSAEAHVQIGQGAPGSEHQNHPRVSDQFRIRKNNANTDPSPERPGSFVATSFSSHTVAKVGLPLWFGPAGPGYPPAGTSAIRSSSPAGHWAVPCEQFLAAAAALRDLVSNVDTLTNQNLTIRPRDSCVLLSGFVRACSLPAKLAKF